MSEMNIDAGQGKQRRVRVDYPSNSNRSKETPAERAPKEKVVTGDVTQRKQSIFKRMASDFITEDSSSVIGYVLMEVMLPAAKNMFSDMVSQGVDRMLYGDSRPRHGSGGKAGYMNYNSVSSRTEAPRTMSRHARATHDFNEMVLATRGEAEDVIDGLRTTIEQFNVATVADLYDLVGLTGEFTDAKWGWEDLRTAKVRPVRGGYLLDLPRTQPLA